MDERITVHLKAWGHTLSTGISVSRSYLSWFESCMSWPVGITCEAVVVVPIAHTYNSSWVYKRYVPMGVRSKTVMRQFDMGATGMCNAEKSVLENAQAELKEELGLELPADCKYRRFSPGEEGFTMIVHLFTFDIYGDDRPKQASPDNTFKRIDWVELDPEMINMWMVANAKTDEIGWNTKLIMPNNWECLKKLL